MDNYNVINLIKNLEKDIIKSLLSEKGLTDKNNKLPTQTQMRIIEYILDHKDQDVYQKDLEDVLKLTRATVSGVLQTMEKNNLIKRLSVNKDARIKKIYLSEKAENMFNKGKEKIINLEKIIKKDLTNEELEMFKKIIIKMNKNINEENGCLLEKGNKND